MRKMDSISNIPEVTRLEEQDLDSGCLTARTTPSLMHIMQLRNTGRQFRLEKEKGAEGEKTKEAECKQKKATREPLNIFNSQ